MRLEKKKRPLYGGLFLLLCYNGLKLTEFYDLGLYKKAA